MGRGLSRRRCTVHEGVDKPARYLKYAVLGGLPASLFEGAARGVSGRPGRAHRRRRRMVCPVNGELLAGRIVEMPTFNPDEIKGVDSFRAVSDPTGIPKEEFIMAFKNSGEDFEKIIREWCEGP